MLNLDNFSLLTLEIWQPCPTTHWLHQVCQAHKTHLPLSKETVLPSKRYARSCVDTIPLYCPVLPPLPHSLSISLFFHSLLSLSLSLLTSTSGTNLSYYKSEEDYSRGETFIQRFNLTGAEAIPDVDVSKKKFAMNIILPSSDETGEIRLVFENVSWTYLHMYMYPTHVPPLFLKAWHQDLSGSAFYWG